MLKVPKMKTAKTSKMPKASAGARKTAVRRKPAKRTTVRRRLFANHQFGGLSFKNLIFIAGGGFVLIIILVIATAPPKAGTPAAQQTPQNGNTPAAADGRSPEIGQIPATELPASFKRFTNRQYNFSVAFPASWGGLSGQANIGKATLLAQTKEVSEPMGASQAFGTFTIGIYPARDFQISQVSLGSMLQPVEKDGVYTWKVASLAADDKKNRVGDLIPVATSKNAAGVTIYDFNWTIQGDQQSRWAFRSKDNFIVMVLPPLNRADKSAPSEDDIKQYRQFTTAVVSSVSLPQQ